MTRKKDTSDEFDLEDFLPYRLNQAAEHVSLKFQDFYRRDYGMTRPEWRVLAHLGQNDTLTARQICDRARMHKTEVSRVIYSLEERRWLTRQRDQGDRRIEHLSLTREGIRVFRKLGKTAAAFEEKMLAGLPKIEGMELKRWLLALNNQ